MSTTMLSYTFNVNEFGQLIDLHEKNTNNYEQLVQFSLNDDII